MSIDYYVQFHPVGQGLFSSGKIFVNRQHVFKFVYDCGTSSKQELLDNAISRLSFHGDIDLLAISHFDNDHISGLGRLLNKNKVKILLLPSLKLSERLYLAYSNGVGVSDAIIAFYLDPIKYLVSKYDDKIEQIILVPSGNKNPEEISDRVADEDLYVDVDSIDDDYQKVKVLKVGGRLVYRSVFEFLPYNDSSVAAKINKSFCNSVEKESATFLSSCGVNDIQASLGRVRDSFDRNFGKTPLKRNVISLFLFAGPCVNKHFDVVGISLSKYKFYRLESVLADRAHGVLYSGDGCLDSKKKLDALINFFGKDRISRIGCFQVMHHGARGSWHSGVAKALSPYFSIFSSDPDRGSLKHPHAEVVRDFLPYSPIQVDKEHLFKVVFNEA